MIGLDVGRAIRTTAPLRGAQQSEQIGMGESEIDQLGIGDRTLA